MKDSVKITVIDAGFKDANKKNMHQKPSFLPQTWKAGREIPDEPVQRAVPTSSTRSSRTCAKLARTFLPKIWISSQTFPRSQAQKHRASRLH